MAERILLVEDDEINQMVAVGILGQLDYVAEVTGSGAEALAMSEASDFGAVLLDCQMPEMDGYELARRWRGREQASPERGRTPIIAMTATATDGDRQRCFDVGMDDFLTKPVRREEIAGVLSRWLPAGPIDHAQLDELRELGAGPDGPLAEIIRSFLAESPASLDELSDAVSRSDPDAVASVAHSLKGMSSALGATVMVELSEALVGQGRAHDLAGAARTVAKLRTEFDRASVELHQVLADNG